MISEISVSGHGDALVLTLADGFQNEINAVHLRQSAMDAVSKRERILSGTIHVTDDICITKINSMGSTGINIHFSDGHEKAIYPFPYLEKLARDSDK